MQEQETVKTRKVSKLTTLYEKQEQVRETIKNVSLENIDEALDLFYECKGLEFDLRDAIYCKNEELQDQIRKREIFTIEEIQNIERVKQKLLNTQQDIELFSSHLRELEDKIVRTIPKVKENFRVRTNKYILEIEGENLTKIVRL